MIHKRTKWLIKGIDLIIEHGFEGFNIDELCGRMKIAKTSFYYHFLSREVFLKELIKYWALELAPTVIEEINKSSVTNDLKRFINHKKRHLQFYCFMIQAKLFTADRKALSELTDQTEADVWRATDKFLAIIVDQESLNHRVKVLMHTFLSGWDYLHGFNIFFKRTNSSEAFMELENFLINFKSNKSYQSMAS